ncbi:PadR family transcriptional regulator [Ferrovibrio sp.]|uniref:PadR family transcriptional regulator n=1 Tax=Ferrovibrio sp. TaxID=1917215 RepID=UPI003D14A3DA
MIHKLFGHRGRRHRGEGHDMEGGEHEHRGPFGHRRHGHRDGRRLFDYGELRLLLLAMIGDAPRHGYELIKAIEERFGGSYSPSPGVIYPTLAWLDDMSYARIEAEAGSRKRYHITPEGEAFLTANRAAVDALLSRQGSSEGRGSVPAPVVRAMENLKLALRLRLRQGPLDAAAAEKIASALDAATQVVERG